MAPHCLLYYITDRQAFPGNESARRNTLLLKIAEAARAGVDYIQLREKDLPTRELEKLTRDALAAVRENSQPRPENRTPTGLLINSRADIALVTGAGGVHLRSDDVATEDVQRLWKLAGAIGQNQAAELVIGVSCHTPQEVRQAAGQGATFAVFAPVFEKKDAPKAAAAGLSNLREACRASIPVLALGGISLENAQSCFDAGAAGIAAIRLFQDNDVAEVVHRLRCLAGRSAC